MTRFFFHTFTENYNSIISCPEKQGCEENIIAFLNIKILFSTGW